MTENIFITKTREALRADFDESFLRVRGFEIEENDKRVEDCILVIGINPAGEKDDAQEKGTYYFYLDNSENAIRTSPKYFKPIWKLTNAITDNNCKWPWLNKEWISIEKELKKDGELDSSISDFRDFYDCHQNAKYTVYCGDMFYYHCTNAKDLKLKEEDCSSYCHEMIKMHLEELKRHNKNVRFVYINNARVSHWLCGQEERTMILVDETPVFFGGMLSGRGAMDNFSKRRVVYEIRGYLGSNIVG